MSSITSIEWTDATWNPVRGCSRVSEGCRNCYAEQIAARFSGPGLAYEGLAKRTSAGARWTGRVELVERHLEDPLRWRDGRRIFVNSMSDLFHEALTDDQIDRVFSVMQACPQHTFQVLTKRPARMLAYVLAAAERVMAAGEDLAAGHGWCHANENAAWPLRNLWIGVSAEDQSSWDERVEILGRVPAAVRFVSAEPLLGPIETGNAFDPPPDGSTYQPVDWVIVGGESGPGARPMDVAWARAIVTECRAAGVAVFVKQLGRRPYDSLVAWQMVGRDFSPTPVHAQALASLALGSAKGGDWDQWPVELRFREFPQVPLLDSPPCEQHAAAVRSC